MTNPLSSYGYSDEDYVTAIGMMVGESSNRSTGQTLLHEMAGQLDVALNRLGSRQTGGRNFGKGRGLSLQDVILAPSQFDAATKTKGRAHKEQYTPAKRAALDDEYLATLSPDMQARVLAAREAALKTAGTKELRGLTKNATTTSSTAYNLKGARLREHNKEGRKTATKIGGTSFYGKGHDRKRSQEQAAAISTKLDQRASTSAPRADTPKERNLSGMTASRGTPAAAAPDVSMGRFYDAPATPAAPAYSPANLDFGPDFSSPPSQARGAVTDPYGFSNINTAAEAAPGSFANYGPNAFGGLDQAPVDYGRTYPEVTAGLYSASDIAPPDVLAVPDIMGQFDPTNFMTEQQAIENAGLEGQRLSENVERRQAPWGESVDTQVTRNADATENNDYLAASYSEIMAPFGVRDNPAAYTTNPYEVGSYVAPERVDKGVWGGTTPFNDKFIDRATPTFQNYENRGPLAGLGIGAIASPGPVGMATPGGVELQRDISGLSAGIYGENPRSVFDAAYGGYTPNIGQLTPEAVIDAIRNAPTTPEPETTGSISGAYSPSYSAGTSAQLGTPDFSALSALDRENAYQAEVAAMRDPAATQARGAWTDQTEAERPTAISVSSPAPTPDWSLGDIGFGPGPEAPVDYGRTYPGVTAGMYEGPELSAFQPSPLGLGQGIIDQGPYSTPIGGFADRSFSPANLGNPMPNSTAVATQAPTPQREIIGYEPGKAITRDVPNPAWSEWSRDYATRNAAQEAWLAADEDKFGWDRAPPNPSILSDTQWAGFKPEPSKTIPETKIGAATPIYGPAPVVQAQPVNVPAIQAQPRVAAAPVASVPAVNAIPATAALTAAPVGVGGWWDSFTNGLGSMFGGLSLSGLSADYSGYGNFGGAYDPGGYGGGGYGGTAPGDAGYGSDARSGSGNMGAGNLYS